MNTTNVTKTLCIDVVGYSSYMLAVTMQYTNISTHTVSGSEQLPTLLSIRCANPMMNYQKIKAVHIVTIHIHQDSSAHTPVNVKKMKLKIMTFKYLQPIPKTFESFLGSCYIPKLDIEQNPTTSQHPGY